MGRGKKVMFLGSILVAVLLLADKEGLSDIYGPPSQPPGSPPYGMNVQGAAAGTKLSGVIVIEINDFRCTDPGSPVCLAAGPDLAFAKGTLRLRKDNEIHAFYLDLGEVPYSDVATVQAIAMEEFRGPILASFFGVSSGSPLGIYLKQIGEFAIGTVVDPTAAPGTYIVDPFDPLQQKIIGFSAVADLVVAVK